MTWRDYEEIQKEICAKFGSDWLATLPDKLIGLATNLEHTPIYGIRYSSGWMIWSGEHSEVVDFYKPVCAVHLVDYFPNTINYLGLSEGWAFIIDKNGYEDVWFDEKYLIE